MIKNFSYEDALAEPVGLDPRVAAFGHAAIANAIRGNIIKAKEQTQNAISVAEKNKHVPSSIFAHHCDAVLGVLLRNPNKVKDCVFIIKKMTGLTPFPVFEALSKIMSAWANGQLGKQVTRKALFSPFFALRRAYGHAARPLWLSLMAQTALSAKDSWLALHLLDEAEEARISTGDELYTAETHRIRGLAYSAEGNSKNLEAAKVAFSNAIDVARRQKANLFRLRSMIAVHRTLTRTRDRTNSKSDIRKTLTMIQGDSDDVIEAKRLR